MTVLRPFKAIHYNPETIKDFSKVVCPPYDVISKEQQTRLHNLSPYNFVHIDLAKETPKDDAANNKYTRSQKTFEEWLATGVLVEDEKPGIYFYKQDYKVMGQRHSRLGFIALMKLEDDGENRIFPHENTHSAAKEDRFQLCSALKAHLSSIFVSFSDKTRKVESIFQRKLSAQKPFIDVTDEEGVRHSVWKLTDEHAIKEIQAALQDQAMFIADGHHRYEVAQQYRKMHLKGKSKSNGQAPFDYIMTYFTNMESRDLKVFPIHRVIRKLPKNIDFLEEFFRIDKIKNRDDLPVLLAKAGRNESAIGIYTRDSIKLLRLKNKLLIDEHIHEGSKEYRQLDATILKYFILDRIGIASEDIIYTKDLPQALNMVDNHEAAASFILNPVQMQQIRAIALNGERMPPKTTYFYPKVLSGLTVYKME